MKNYVTLLFMALICTVSAYSQCGGYSATTTPAGCPSTGVITISPANATSYQITSGPAGGGYSTSAQSSNIFNSLPAGAYTITIICGGNPYTVNATVTTTYVAPDFTTAVTNLCTNYTPGGTITVTSPGSATPLSYGIYFGTDAAAPDASFTFGTTNTFDVTAFGIYQIRVKDACGNFITKSVSLQPTTPQAKLTTSGVYFDRCSPTNAAIRHVVYITSTSGGSPVLSSTVKYKLEVWESTDATCSGATTAPATPPTQTITIDNVWFNAGSTIYLDISTKSYYYRLTSICGPVYEACYVLPTTTLTPTLLANCTQGTNTNYSIAVASNLKSPFTIVLTGYDASNNVLFTNSTFTTTATGTGAGYVFDNIPPADHYSYTLTDDCGRTVAGTLRAITPTAPFLGAVPNCTSVIGAEQVDIGFYGNWVGLTSSVNPSSFQLVNNATGASTSPSILNFATRIVRFSNIVPGNYTLRFTSADGCITEVPITIPDRGVFYFNFTASATQYCGTGDIKGTISTNNTTSGVTYTLKNSAGATIATNTSGNFTGLAAGTYTITASLGSCSISGPPLITASKTLTILPLGALPEVTTALGFICDGGTGGITTLSFNGTGPFKVEQKEASQPISSFTTLTTTATSDYSVSGLTPNTTYDYRVTDACGNAVTTQVTVKDLTAITKLTSSQPCDGQPYTLAVESIPTATYAWTFNGGTNVISTTNSINFSSYNPNSNGTYTCTVKIGSCIVRTATFTINSLQCGQALSVNFGSITATIKNGILNLSWTSLSEKNIAMYEIEISKDGQHFYSIGSLPTKAEGGNSTDNIEYSFSTPLSKALAGTMSVVLLGLVSLINVTRRKKLLLFLIGFVAIVAVTGSCNKKQLENVNTDTGNVYVRIATIDKDGVKSYSKVVKAIQK